MLTRNDGTITEPGKDTLEYLLKSHFPSIKSIKETDYTEYKLQSCNSGYKPEWITVEKLKTVFNIFKSKKSPGPDGLKPLVLKNLTEDKLKELIF